MIKGPVRNLDKKLAENNEERMRGKKTRIGMEDGIVNYVVTIIGSAPGRFGTNFSFKLQYVAMKEAPSSRTPIGDGIKKGTSGGWNAAEGRKWLPCHLGIVFRQCTLTKKIFNLGTPRRE